MKLQDIIPPIFYKLKNKFSSPVDTGMKEYDSFESALNDSMTYEDAGVISVVSRKTRNFIASLKSDHVVNHRQSLQNMFVLQYVQGDPPYDIIELGGACGATYFELGHMLPGRIRNWFIVESPAMAHAGSEEFEDNTVKFFDDPQRALNKMAHPDMVVAQGVLQYMPDPVRALKDLFDVGSQWIYISRTLLGCNIDEPVITKQTLNLSSHGPGEMPDDMEDRETSQPVTIIPHDMMMHMITESSYKITFVFNEDLKFKMRIGNRKIITKHMGFLLKEKGS